MAISAASGPTSAAAPPLDLAVAAARTAIEIESRSVTALLARIDDDFTRAVELLGATTGHVIVSGIGKSGHIGRKMAATLASTGTPAFFVHATEALHGDAGMVTDHDVAILISNSGETAEVCHFAALLAERGRPFVAMTGRPSSTLAIESTVHLMVGVEREADPLDLAPTASTTATLAMGDALAAALMVLHDVGAEDFARHHPGGSLGQRLTTPTDPEVAG